MEKISDRQLTGIMIMVILLGLSVSGIADRSMQNAWLATLCGIIIAAPFYFMYARITGLFEGCGLFEIIYQVFGRVFGGILVMIMSLYSLGVGSASLRQMSEFNKISSMPETSQILTMIFLITACIYILKKGVSTLARFTGILIPIILLFFLTMPLFSIKDWNLDNIFPIMGNVNGYFLSDMFTTATCPFGEIILITPLFAFKKNKTNNYKIYFIGLLIGGFIIFLDSLRCIAVMGAHTMSLLYYPMYIATGIINVMDFFNRVESLSIGMFIFMLIVKICVCIYVFSSGLGSVIGSSNYKSLITPSAFLMVALSLIIFKNTIQSFKFMEIYKYYGLVFQAIIPAAIWIGAEITVKNRKRLEAVPMG
ncbi:MAG: endospore germination permease [Bacillota bacterium]|nr:endospore germination permease [Bacillota bacterium]